MDATHFEVLRLTERFHALSQEENTTKIPRCRTDHQLADSYRFTVQHTAAVVTFFSPQINHFERCGIVIRVGLFGCFLFQNTGKRSSRWLAISQ